MKNVIVIGGGPAGMIAAGICAERGMHAVILEKNNTLGRKLALTGKGRCNVTNASPPEDLLADIMGHPFFLYSSFYTFDSDMTMGFFERLGVSLKVERGNRVFPASDDAKDVVAALQKFLRKNNVEIRCGCRALDIVVKNRAVYSVVTENREYKADAVVIATGGMSYPGTGSTGDGYRLAQALGHHIVTPLPSLVPLKTKESWAADLQGLSLRNIAIQLKGNGKTVYTDFGEMLFTHYGVSGPVILSASRHLRNIQGPLVITIDLKPALTEKELDNRLLRDFDKYRNREVKNALNDLLPGKLIPVIAGLSGIPDKRVHDVTRADRKALLHLLKQLTLHVSGHRGWNEAIITAGGVSVDEIDPATMASKLVTGLYFAGEILDVDGPTGGYNLQIAFSTGYAAGMHC